MRHVLRYSARSEERRVGKECRSRWSPKHQKKHGDLRDGQRNHRHEDGETNREEEKDVAESFYARSLHCLVLIARHLSANNFFFFSSRRRHTRLTCDWSSDVCSSDLAGAWTCARSILWQRHRIGRSA